MSLRLGMTLISTLQNTVDYLLISVAIGVYCVTCLASGTEPEMERWDRAVCLSTEHKSDDGMAVSASGFLVVIHGQVYLITAKHSAVDTNSDTRVIYRSKSGESQWVNLGGIVDAKTNPWLNYENSDLSIARLITNADNRIYMEELTELAIAFDALKTETPRRTTTIEIVGFPLTFGSRPPVSAFAMVAHIASKTMPAAAQWGTETVFYAVPTVANGTSGGPVFNVVPDSKKCEIVGMYIGSITDSNGAKLSRIIPSNVIRAALVRHHLDAVGKEK